MYMVSRCTIFVLHYTFKDIFRDISFKVPFFHWFMVAFLISSDKIKF